MPEHAAKISATEETPIDLGADRQILNMGPSHPATHGTVKFTVEIEGETVVEMDVAVGYLHRGFEKECESGTYYQAIPYTDRLNYVSAILGNLGYCMTVEKLLGIETPRHASLLEARKGQNAQRPMLEDVREIQRRGIVVWAGMIVGFDHDDVGIFREQFDFLMEANIPVSTVGLLVALPKTPLSDRLAREGSRSRCRRSRSSRPGGAAAAPRPGRRSASSPRGTTSSGHGCR